MELLSRWHRQEDQAKRRRKLVQDSLPMLGLTEEQYKDLEGVENFLPILGVALELKISWHRAEITFYDRRREARDAHLQQQLNVNSWQGDGTDVHVPNKEANFGDDVTFWFHFKGKPGRRK